MTKDLGNTPGQNTGPNAGRSKIPGTKLIVLTLQPDALGKGRVFKLHKDRIVIGTVGTADVRLGGDGIAPIHAVLEISKDQDGMPGAAVVYDLASETGLFVNGAKVITQPLKPGDVLTIGKHKLAYSLQDVSQISKHDPVRESEGRKLFLNPGEDLIPLNLMEDNDLEEIFDYRPSQGQALEAVMSWHGTILDVQHFVKEKAITVGNGKGTDFGIPAILSASRFPLVTRQGEDGYTLNLDTQMSGVIQRQGALQTLEGVRSTAVRGPDGYQIPLSREDFAKISIGEIDFYLSFTSAPPRLKMRKMFEKDPLFLKILASSMVMTAVIVTALWKAHIPQTLEAEQLPERMATILFQPEKYTYHAPVDNSPTEAQVDKTTTTPPTAKPTPKATTKLEITPHLKDLNKPIPKVLDMGSKTATAPKSSQKANSKSQNQAKEGKGARAKGDEGTRGTKTAAANKEHQNAAKRPSPQGGPGAGDGNSQITDQGNVDLLKGASDKIQNLLGNSAAHLGKGGEKLQGFGGFNTQGNGGLALSGSGKGGGGDAASLGGLANEGRGGGRVGTGQGAAGNGNGIVGGKARVVIRSGGPEEAVVMGSIDADAVEAALLAHRDEFRLCYEKEINAETPNLAGRVGTSFVIGSTGRVTQAGIESTSLKNANAERCILNVIRRIDFPVPGGGGVVQVTYPFKFNPVGK